MSRGCKLPRIRNNLQITWAIERYAGKKINGATPPASLKRTLISGRNSYQLDRKQGSTLTFFRQKERSQRFCETLIGYPSKPEMAGWRSIMATSQAPFLVRS